ncbi:tetratricopeptide repeat protein, partial [Devosia sp.]
RALQLNPDQPQVLNYLGYSWVDQGVNLIPALDMIQKAVAAAPNDGYIIDSLGWAYYRLGRFDEAVQQLELAVQLRSTDPEINDHLGDAYWRAGRTLEAKFQWNIAASVDKEGNVKARVAKKLAEGLDAVEAAPERGPVAEGATAPTAN